MARADSRAMIQLASICCPTRASRGRRAFTLLELLVALGVVATLTAMVLGAVAAAKNRSAVHLARAELAEIAQRLEAYRREFGAYPRTADTPEKLLAALAGTLGPTGAAITGRCLLDDFTLTRRERTRAGERLVDPWERPYRCIFYTRSLDSGVVVDGFVLYSVGERGAGEALPTDQDVVPETTGPHGGAVARAAICARNLYVRS